MKTYLLAWKPIRSEWDDLPETSDAVKEGRSEPIRWSCGKSKLPQKGDRVFLIKLGKKPKGIFGSGHIVRGPYEDTHWDYERARKGETSNFVKVKLDTLLNPDTESILDRELLNEPPFSDMHWDTQMSGVHIPDHVATELEILWNNFMNSIDFSFPEEVANRGRNIRRCSSKSNSKRLRKKSRSTKAMYKPLWSKMLNLRL